MRHLILLPMLMLACSDNPQGPPDDDICGASESLIGTWLRHGHGPNSTQLYSTLTISTSDDACEQYEYVHTVASGTGALIYESAGIIVVREARQTAGVVEMDAYSKRLSFRAEDVATDDEMILTPRLAIVWADAMSLWGQTWNRQP